LRVVFDTNVLVSALLVPDSLPRKALDGALQKGTVLLSYAVLSELYDVLSRKHFQKYVDEDDIQAFVAALTREAEWVDADIRIVASRDAKDDKFLELAVGGRATHIVTGDSDLLVLHPFRGIAIISPATFLTT